MQDITSEICTATSEGKEVQLEDKRDGNKYWVGKMKDGRCWMLQNLALGSTSGTTALTSANSNVTSDWSLPAAYTSSSSGGTANAAIKTYNFGKWVLATPLLTADCGKSSAPNPANCTKIGLVDVSDTTKFQPTYTAITRSWDGANANSSTLVAVNCTSWSGSGTSKTCTAGTYDAHYLTGNWYSWNAATAETGGSITSGQASSSICPKGWKLPTSNTTAIGSFGGLLSQYGISTGLSGTINGATYNIAGTPLRFVRSGSAGPGDNVGYSGGYGYYWSSTPTSGGTNAYRLYFNPSKVDSSNSAGRSHGFSVRCVAEYTNDFINQPFGAIN